MTNNGGNYSFSLSGAALLRLAGAPVLDLWNEEA